MPLGDTNGLGNSLKHLSEKEIPYDVLKARYCGHSCSTSQTARNSPIARQEEEKIKKYNYDFGSALATMSSS
ncbi:hypothetical protein KC360_g65 [Hortaea werneckii]|nr:hypothetical protein KC360_g65 [Hortaea werneckii]